MDSSQDLGESVFVAEDPALFGTFDALVVLGANKRRQVTELLNDILRETSQESNDAALALEESLLAVTNLWNEFHREYAQWRSTQEGCDRLAAVETLGTFSVRFGELAASARTLPSLTVMRPLVELLVEAAEQEGDAMRQLRDSWVPFDTRVYARYDQKRNEASRLRRQVSSSLSALLPEYGISAQEVTS